MIGAVHTPNRCYTPTKLHGVTFQGIVVLIVTAFRTPNVRKLDVFCEVGSGSVCYSLEKLQLEIFGETVLSP